MADIKTVSGVTVDVPTHAALTTGVHGAGANTILYSDHAAVLATHGITFARLTADSAAVNNSTTLVNITGLAFAIAANEIWTFEITIWYSSNATANIKFAVTTPTGSTVRYTLIATVIDGAALYPQVNATASGTTGIADGAAAFAKIVGIVVNGATAGNVQAQFAQNTANVSDTTVLANSHLVAKRLA